MVKDNLEGTLEFCKIFKQKTVLLRPVPCKCSGTLCEQTQGGHYKCVYLDATPKEV